MRPFVFSTKHSAMETRTKNGLAFSAFFLLACGGAEARVAEPEVGAEAEVQVDPQAHTNATLGEALEQDPPRPETLAGSLAGIHRTPEARARDQYRHPIETLEFFGFQPEQQVVEVWPGAGWYTKIVAPVMWGRGGAFYAAGFDANGGDRRAEYQQRLLANLESPASYYSDINHMEFTAEEPLTDIPDNWVDLVLAIRVLHNMTDNIDVYMQNMARILKPGGVLGVVQHRLPEGLEGVPADGSAGYLTEAYVIERAEAAGLVLDARSEINANPNDTHNHPEGVWSLPPAHRGGDPALLEVGESDRMTLRFVKPAAQ